MLFKISTIYFTTFTVLSTFYKFGITTGYNTLHYSFLKRKYSLKIRNNSKNNLFPNIFNLIKLNSNHIKDHFPLRSYMSSTNNYYKNDNNIPIEHQSKYFENNTINKEQFKILSNLIGIKIPLKTCNSYLKLFKDYRYVRTGFKCIYELDNCSSHKGIYIAVNIAISYYISFLLSIT